MHPQMGFFNFSYLTWTRRSWFSDEPYNRLVTFISAYSPTNEPVCAMKLAIGFLSLDTFFCSCKSISEHIDGPIFNILLQSNGKNVGSIVIPQETNKMINLIQCQKDHYEQTLMRFWMFESLEKNGLEEPFRFALSN